MMSCSPAKMLLATEGPEPHMRHAPGLVPLREYIIIPGSLWPHSGRPPQMHEAPSEDGSTNGGP